MAGKTRGLGRGFDSLIPMAAPEAEFDVTATTNDEGQRVSGDVVREIAPELVDPNPHQPRTEFDEEALQALAASIRVHGILNPLVASKVGNRYELIAGERRLRAARIAGLEAVPIIVRTIDEQQKLELALLENIQREELNPLELAAAYKKLVDQFGMHYTEIGEKVGKDGTTIVNAMRLLQLPMEAKHAIVDGKITESHGRTILALEKEPDKMLHVLESVIKYGWNVRKTEEYIRGLKGKKGSMMRAKMRLQAMNNFTRGIGDFLGTKVTQQNTAHGGRLLIEYYSEEELERIYKVIRRED